jgi:hypothetical protein
MYKTNILARLHKDRLIEYDRAQKRARISPKGSAYVEREIIAPRIA